MLRDIFSCKQIIVQHGVIAKSTSQLQNVSIYD